MPHISEYKRSKKLYQMGGDRNERMYYEFMRERDDLKSRLSNCETWHSNEYRKMKLIEDLAAARDRLAIHHQDPAAYNKDTARCYWCSLYKPPGGRDSGVGTSRETDSDAVVRPTETSAAANPPGHVDGACGCGRTYGRSAERDMEQTGVRR